MESSIQVQILDEAVCILLYANFLGKAMNTSLFPELLVNNGTDAEATSLGKGKLLIQISLLLLQIDVY